MEEKKIKEEQKLVSIILLICSVIVFSIGLLLKRDELKIVMLAIGAGLCLAAMIARMFGSKLGYKSTREKMEEKIFGNK